MINNSILYYLKKISDGFIDENSLSNLVIEDKNDTDTEIEIRDILDEKKKNNKKDTRNIKDFTIHFLCELCKKNNFEFFFIFKKEKKFYPIYTIFYDELGNKSYTRKVVISPDMKHINNNIQLKKSYEIINDLIDNTDNSHNSHNIKLSDNDSMNYSIENFDINNLCNIYLYTDNILDGVISFGNRYQNKTSFIIKNKFYIDIYPDMVSKLKPIIPLLRYIVLDDIYKSDIIHKQDGKLFPSKELFLASMSHEIRTPLNGIIGYNQLLGKTRLNSIQKNYINSMNQCCTQLLEIVNDVLDYSKLSSEKMSLSEECFSIKDVTEFVKSIVNSKITEKKQQLIFNIDKNIPVFIITDKSKLSQILLNIISNANKFSPENTGKIIVDIKCIENNICFDVMDNGIGIEDNNIPLLFNIYKQLNNNPSKTGTGLGLAISKKLVELLGGTITVKSEINKGTTFSFYIKFTVKENMEKLIIDNIDIMEDKYVLIVDDNHNNRLMLSDYLFEWKMNPISCGSGIEAIRYLHSNRYSFSFCLIDIIMPEMGGEQLAKIIKEYNNDLPIIALSSGINIINNNKLFEYRLEKPVDKIKLFNTIYKVMKNCNAEFLLNSKSIENVAKKSPKINMDTNGKNIEIDKNIIGKNIEEDKKIDKMNKRKLKIHIAEDVIYNYKLLRDMLNNIGYKNITISTDGKKCINRIRKNMKKNIYYDILFLDLKMPVLDGYEVIKYIKRKKLNTKIVIVSASVLESEKNKCNKMGVNYFIPKPIDMRNISRVINYILEKDM